MTKIGWSDTIDEIREMFGHRGCSDEETSEVRHRMRMGADFIRFGLMVGKKTKKVA